VLNEMALKHIITLLEDIEATPMNHLTDSPTCRHLMPLILILALSFTLRLAGVSGPRPGPQ